MISDRIRSMQIGVDIVCKLEAQLRACKREKRRMFKAFHCHCIQCYAGTGCRYGALVVWQKCTLRNCPLLKKEGK